jgi:uncharacterized membrane protein YhaH (DUF805 family)
MLMFKPFMKYADFKGRARRSEYWLFVLFQAIVYIVLFMVMMAGFASSLAERNLSGALNSVGVIGIMSLFSLGCFVPNLAVTVRRLHDSGKSFLWLLLLAPSLLSVVTSYQMVGSLMTGDTETITAAYMRASALNMVATLGYLGMLVLMCLPGTSGPNRYGDDPKGGSSSADIARIFDAPEPDDARPAYAEPHKPVFDFGPSRGVPTVREAAPAPAPQPRYTPAPAPAGNPLAPGATRPTFGKRR